MGGRGGASRGASAGGAGGGGLPTDDAISRFGAETISVDTASIASDPAVLAAMGLPADASNEDINRRAGRIAESMMPDGTIADHVVEWKVTNDGGWVSFKGDIVLHGEGDKAGAISRFLTPGTNGIPSVLHDSIYVDANIGTTGIGRKMLASSIPAYQKLDVQQIQTEAGPPIGPYVWSRMGFQASPAAVASSREMVAERIRYGVRPEAQAGHLARLGSTNTMHDLAGFRVPSGDLSSWGKAGMNNDSYVPMSLRNKMVAEGRVGQHTSAHLTVGSS